MRILIADDHEVIRRGVARVLQSRGDVEEYAEATNGEEAVEKALEWKPDLVLLDIRLPVLSGFEVSRLIKQHQPETLARVVRTRNEADENGNQRRDRSHRQGDGRDSEDDEQGQLGDEDMGGSQRRAGITVATQSCRSQQCLQHAILQRKGRQLGLPAVGTGSEAGTPGGADSLQNRGGRRAGWLRLRPTRSAAASGGRRAAELGRARHRGSQEQPPTTTDSTPEKQLQEEAAPAPATERADCLGNRILQGVDALPGRRHGPNDRRLRPGQLGRVHPRRQIGLVGDDEEGAIPE